MKLASVFVASFLSAVAFADGPPAAQVEGLAMLSGASFGAVSSVSVANARLSTSAHGTSVVTLDLQGTVETAQKDASKAIALVEPLAGQSPTETRARISVGLFAPTSQPTEVWLGATGLNLFARDFKLTVALDLGVSPAAGPRTLALVIPLEDLLQRKGVASLQATIDGQVLTVAPLEVTWQKPPGPGLPQ